MSRLSPAVILFDVSGSVMAVTASMQIPSGTTGIIATGVGTDGIVRYHNVDSNNALKVTGSFSTIPVGTQTVTGSVQVLNQVAVTITSSLPVTIQGQPVQVTGSVGVTNFPATQTVTGTVSLTAQPIQVTGSILAYPTGTQTVTGSVIAVLTGTLTTAQIKSSGSATTSVSGSTSTVTLLAINANRLGATVFNESVAVLYLKLGVSASATSYAVRMVPYSYYEVPFNYYARIDGIWTSATGSARVTELT